MANVAVSRLQKELRENRSEKSTDIELIPKETDIMIWKAFIKGPSDTPYHNGRFEIAIHIPSTYPFAPPRARFITKIFHPNVHFKTGDICLDILKTQWSPAWTLFQMCQAVLVLLSAPEASSPFNCDAGNMIRAGDTIGFNSMASMYTYEHAMQHTKQTQH